MIKEHIREYLEDGRLYQIVSQFRSLNKKYYDPTTGKYSKDPLECVMIGVDGVTLKDIESAVMSYTPTKHRVTRKPYYSKKPIN